MRRLVSARWVLPISAPPLEDGGLILDGEGTILAVGGRADLRADHGDLPEDPAEGVLLPGLVNAHTHLELSALAGRIPGGDGLVPWATRLVSTRAADAARADRGPPEREDPIARAAEDAVAFGTAAVGDTGNHLAAVAAIARSGLLGVFFHELLGSLDSSSGDALAEARREREAFGAWPATVAYVPAPHAPYSCGPDLLERIFAAAGKLDRPTSIHVAEDEDEISMLRSGTGRWTEVLRRLGVTISTRVPGLGPLAYLERLGALAAPRPPLLVHMVHADSEDRRLAAKAGATAVLCPRSNLYIGGRIADVPALLRDGVHLALGTDSLASSPDVSVWAEMAALAERHPNLDPYLWLGAATLGGARALGLERLGDLAPGKRPGVIDVAVEDLSAPLPSLVRNPRPAVRWIVRPGRVSA